MRIAQIKTLNAEAREGIAEARRELQYKQFVFSFANLRATSARLRVQSLLKLVLTLVFLK